MNAISIEAIMIITLSLIFSFGIEVFSFFNGFMNIHEHIPRIFRTAARMKNEFPEPAFSAKIGIVTLAMKNGKIIALVAEPTLPSMFIVPETAPELLPPISIQNVQLGAIVISTPKTAIPKQVIKAKAEMFVIRVHKMSPVAARANPTIAGILLDATW
jgi:hypothetical protein